MPGRALILILILAAAPALAADGDHISITEVQISGVKADDEFVRLTNAGAVDIDLAGWKLTKKYLSKDECKESTLVSTDHFAGTIPAGGTFLIAHQSYRDFYAADLDYSGKSYYLTDNTAVLLYDRSGTLVDRRAVGNVCDEPADDPVEVPEDTVDVAPAPPTPVTGRINEIFPNPETKGEPDEWIEFFNAGGATADLSGFELRDASKSGAYTFPAGTVIPTGEYLVVPKSASKLSLNNSDETVTLLDRDGGIVDAVSYDKTTEEASLNWDGGSYRWSKHRTPGAANVLNNAPKKKSDDIPDTAYKNVAAAFSAKGSDRDKEKLKYKWDFGDDHKSYKRETTHTYKKTGKYRGSLTISDGTEETVEKFTVKVEEYPKRKIRIIALAPNPSGRDEDTEWVLVRNEEKKKSVDLTGWSVATGSKKGKLTNHPIRTDVMLRPGEERKLTSLDAKFSLPNKGGYVELRLPDKRAVQKLDYRDPDGVPDGATYRKADGGGWAWELATPVETEAPAPESLPEPTIDEIPIIDPEFLGGVSWIDERRKTEALPRLVAAGTRVVSPYLPAVTMPRVMGESTERPSGSIPALFEAANAAINRIISAYLS